MKKILLPLCFIFSSLLFTNNVFALTLNPSFGVYNQEETFEVQLQANPKTEDQNALSVRLSAKNSIILDFKPQNSSEFVGFTMDCNNGESYFTSTEVCFSVVKSSPFKKDELLATITYKVSSVNTATLEKVEGNAYSNGQEKVEDLGIAAEFFTDESLKNLSFAVSAPLNESVDNTNVIILSIGGLVVFALLILLFVKRDSLKQLLKNKKTRVIVLIVGFGVLVASFAGAAVVINNNQALDQSSAAVSISCTSPATFLGCGLSTGGVTCKSTEKACGYTSPSVRIVCIPEPNCNPIITYRNCPSRNLKHGQSTSCTPQGIVYKCNDGKIEESKSNCTCNFDSKDILPDRVECIKDYYRKCVNGRIETGNYCGVNCPNVNLNNGQITSCNSSGFQLKCENGKVLNLVCSQSSGTTNPPTTGGGTTNNGDTSTGGGTTTNPPTTGGGGSNTVATCPSSIQARFGITYQGEDLGLVNGGEFYKTKINLLFTVVVLNQNVNQYYNSPTIDQNNKLVITGPQGTILTTPVGTPYQIKPNEMTMPGTYTVTAYAGNNECAKSSIKILEDKLTNPPGDQLIIGGDTWPCGEMDKNLDGKLTVIDFANFAKIYNKKCISKDFKYGPCGGADSNLDGKIDVIDFGSFGLRYNKVSCAIQ